MRQRQPTGRLQSRLSSPIGSYPRRGLWHKWFILNASTKTRCVLHATIFHRGPSANLRIYNILEMVLSVPFLSAKVREEHTR